MNIFFIQERIFNFELIKKKIKIKKIFQIKPVIKSSTNQYCLLF